MNDKSELEMSSVEAQLCVLYAEKQRLEEELGSSQTEDILALVDELNARIADLENVATEVPGLDETDALRVRVAELVAEREAFLLSVDATDFDSVRTRLSTIQSNQKSSTPIRPMSTTNDYDAIKALDNAIDMANDVSNSSVQDALTIAKDLRTMAEQLGSVFTTSKVTFSGRLNGGQWKLECHNG
jgi:hypothetical protein